VWWRFSETEKTRPGDGRDRLARDLAPGFPVDVAGERRDLDSIALAVEHQTVETPDGWELHLKRTAGTDRLVAGRRPILIVPGYGMNAFIFGFHPRGTSMERYLAEAGFEVWSANLRGQGPSRRLDPRAPGPSLRAHAETDVTAVARAVRDRTRTEAPAVDLVGASLGGSIAYAHLALVRDTPVHGLVAIGAPLCWTEIHPVLRTAFASPWIAGNLVIRGVRPVMRAAAPILRWYPDLLTIYMNTGHVDLTAIDEMLNTVEDPNPRVNRDIAKWMRARDLVLRGVNVTEALRERTGDRPLLVVVSNRDGIVPESANLSVLDAWSGADAQILRVGDDENWYAHADLFIGNDAPRVLFEPMAAWLLAREEPYARVRSR
jgi:pimeloyl-ACP methyl ester carboxylesterase